MTDWEELGWAAPIRVEQDGEMVNFEPLKKFTTSVQFYDMNPDLLNLLTGGVLSSTDPVTHAMELWVPIKRTFWQWLRRKPRQHKRIYLPNVEIDCG